MVSAIILAGGYATRLRPLSLTRPKALLPILGRPLIDYIFDSLDIEEIDKIYLSLRVMADRFISYLEKKGISNIKELIPVIEEEKLGDAGPLKLIAKNYELSDDVLVIYGDIYQELDIRSLIKFHEKQGCEATVVGKYVDDPRRYGVLLTNGDQLIQVIEKPKNPISNLINAGIYIFKKKLFDQIEGTSIAKDFLPKLLSENVCISVYKYEGIWTDIGVPSDYTRINFELLMRKYPKGFIHGSAKVSEKVNLVSPYYIGENTKIEDESYVFNSILDSNNMIGKGVYLERTITLGGVKIDNYSFVKDSIIGEKSDIGKWTRLDSVILGDEVVVSDGIFINRETIVLPYKEVTESVYDKEKIIL